MNVLLVSTYDLGRQPFGVASAARWLEDAGARVTCADLAVESLGDAAVREAELIAAYVPMHTATRLAVPAIERARSLNPAAHLCAFGLYAPLNAACLRRLGVQTIIGGEFEAELAALARRLGAGTPAAPIDPAAATVFLDRLAFRVPRRGGLPPLERYARLAMPDGSRRLVGTTEASRGCKHRCRHCPIVPVYAGQFRVVQREVVLDDVRQQVRAGAQHITFGDPDFFNGPAHALELVRALHREFPRLSYDVTIKVEHLLRHARHLPELVATGCAFVVTAVESIDDRVLELLDKGHTGADFRQVVEQCRAIGLELAPTFVPFTPWLSIGDYRALLREIAELDLIGHVASIQLAIRLLIPAGSRLLELDQLRGIAGPFDERTLTHPWVHPDPRVDALQRQVHAAVGDAAARGLSRDQAFRAVWELAHDGAAEPAGCGAQTAAPRRAPIPYLTEPWYC